MMESTCRPIAQQINKHDASVGRHYNTRVLQVGTIRSGGDE